MDKIDAGRAVSRLRREAANSAPKAPRSEPAHTGEPGSPEWWRSPVCAIRGPVDTILRLLEQEEVSRRKALELMAHLYIAFPYDLRAEPAPAPPRAPWAALNWCDDRSDITPSEACRCMRLGGADVQALEHALTITEGERDSLRAVVNAVDGVLQEASDHHASRAEAVRLIALRAKVARSLLAEVALRDSGALQGYAARTLMDRVREYLA